MKFPRYLLFALLALVPALSFAQREKLPPEDLEIIERDYPDARISFTGLRWQVTKPGTGDPINAGDLVKVLYVGKLIDGKVFDKATDPAQAFSFRVGRGQVIEGWEEAFQKLRLGEKATIIVPFELGYGSRGDPPKIPRRATLIFDVEVIGVERS